LQCNDGVKPAAFQNKFQFLQSSVAVIIGSLGAIGHEFQMHYTINITENSEHNCATGWCDLQNSLMLANFCDRLKMMHVAFIPNDILGQELSLSH
jgi:hypothetical protein